jgi:hypothetical protein
MHRRNKASCAIVAAVLFSFCAILAGAFVILG